MVVLMIAGLTSCSREYQFVQAKRIKQNNMQAVTVDIKNRVDQVSETVTVYSAVDDVCSANENLNYETTPQKNTVSVTLQNKITENPQTEKVLVSTKIVSPQPVTVAKENQMPASEKKDVKEAKNAALHSGDLSPAVCALIAFFIPPLGVALYENDITTNFWIDLLLTLLFFIKCNSKWWNEECNKCTHGRA